MAHLVAHKFYFRGYAYEIRLHVAFTNPKRTQQNLVFALEIFVNVFLFNPTDQGPHRSIQPKSNMGVEADPECSLV